MVVDRDRPDESLLLVFGLPDRHPGKIPQVFRNQDAINYRRVRDWIATLNKDPGYGIKLPGSKTVNQVPPTVDYETSEEE